MNIIVPHSDRLIQAHRYFTGAKDTAILNELVRYSRGQGLLSNLRLWPMKSRQGFGTGPTVRGIGLLTSNDMNLVNGPTHTEGGLAFVAASSQYGSIDDFLGSETITVFARVSQASATPTGQQMIWAQDGGAGQRSKLLVQRGDLSGDPYRIFRSSDGTTAAASFETYDSAGSLGSTAERTIVCQLISGGGRSLWFNKTAISISLSSANSVTAQFDTTENFTFAASNSGGVLGLFTSMTGTALATITGDLTTPQRETLTDMINAL